MTWTGNGNDENVAAHLYRSRSHKNDARNPMREHPHANVQRVKERGTEKGEGRKDGKLRACYPSVGCVVVIVNVLGCVAAAKEAGIRGDRGRRPPWMQRTAACLQRGLGCLGLHQMRGRRRGGLIRRRWGERGVGRRGAASGAHPRRGLRRTHRGRQRRHACLAGRRGAPAAAVVVVTLAQCERQRLRWGARRTARPGTESLVGVIVPIAAARRVQAADVVAEAPRPAVAPVQLRWRGHVVRREGAATSDLWGEGAVT